MHHLHHPEGNELAFADMAHLYDNAALWSIHVFSIASLQDAIAFARKDRDPKLVQAMQLFSDLQTQLYGPDKAILYSQDTRDTLKHILELAPNDLSAKNLLAISDGTASKTLSANGTYYQLSVIYNPFRQILHNADKLDRLSLPTYVTINARKRLAALRPIADKKLLPLVADISNFIEAMDAFAEDGKTGANLVDRAEKLDARFASLSADKNFIEKLVREGY